MPEQVSKGAVGAGMCAKMSIATFARKYPAVMDALLRSLLELVCTYHRICAGCGPAARAQHSSHLLAPPQEK